MHKLFEGKNDGIRAILILDQAGAVQLPMLPVCDTKDCVADLRIRSAEGCGFYFAAGTGVGKVINESQAANLESVTLLPQNKRRL
jgi:hypothetical protein